jgi:hypothetical protein
MLHFAQRSAEERREAAQPIRRARRPTIDSYPRRTKEADRGAECMRRYGCS